MNLELASFPVQEVETFSKPGTADVTPSDLKKISPIVKHYAAMAHPFTACYRDQIKHGLSEDHAKRRCAVVKMLGGRSAGNVVKEQVAEAMGWPVDRLDRFVADCKRELAAITANAGVEAVQEAMGGGLAFMLLESDQADGGPESLMEVDLSSSGRKKMASAKTAMPDGSFPIPTVEFLRKAVKAVGRAKDPAAAKAHIKKRARALGATKMLPSSWAMAEAESELFLMAEELAATVALLDPLPEKVGEAYNPPSWVIPKAAKQPGFHPIKPPKKSSSSNSSSSKYDPQKHPRDQLGQFLAKGHTGPAVKGVQQKLGIKTSGTYDAHTKQRVMQYQRNHNLVVDGIVGAQTAASLLGKGSRQPGALPGGLRKRLQGVTKMREEDEQLAERTVHTEARQRDNGVKSASHSSIRSAIFDLSDRTTPTHTVKLPNGTEVKVEPASIPSYGSYGRTFSVSNGKETLSATGVEEAADTAKELDSRQPGASGTPVSTATS